ncbi:MAG: sigma 54-interacting transcriptional regulator [Deltaproteobacteria bacterium]|nr:sigma 54-interacting transcriptional regulator [Deltaproteobacteria bacterium]
MIERELNRYWKTVVDTIHDGLMVVDKRGIIVSVNKALLKLTGYTRSEMVGKSCRMLHCDICEAAMDQCGDQWCVLFRTGAFNMRKGMLHTKDGRRIHIFKNASLLFDEDDTLIGAVETITDITEVMEKETQLEVFRQELRSQDGLEGVLGISGRMQQVFELARNAARSDVPVLILGESGTGKDMLATAIHRLGVRRRKPFVKVSCAALTESLLESELFGHTKGAFTGAYRNREGRFEAAAGGDIFLDEIGDLPLSTQVKLLRVLEENVIERVGDNTPIPVNVRVISATNRDLKQQLKDGLFREDLYYRINVIPITLPPLRKRTEDIPILAESFFRRGQLKTHKKIEGVSEAVMRIFMEYPWPGNVRELKSAFEYAFVSCPGPMIQPQHLPPNFLENRRARALAKETLPEREARQRRELIHALKQARGNKSEAARILGISRVTVWNRMKRFGIDVRAEVRF